MATGQNNKAQTEIYGSKQSLSARFWQYQGERFPVFSNGLLIASFSFSAVAYSRICRGAEGFISPGTFIAGAVITITIFFLLRIFDEHKDAEDDLRYRSHLPVPRGLISLKELRNIAIGTILLQVLVQLLFFPAMFPLYFLVMGYLFLMGKEFFIARWLKRHQFWYVVTHMMIIPLVDVYASGLDWWLADVAAPTGLLYFFLVSFMNGLVLEVGRKIRVAENEEFNTYSTMLGQKKATWLWLALLCCTLGCALAAAQFARYGNAGFFALLSLFFLCAVPGLNFLRRKTVRSSKFIEYSSGIWTIGMYLALGGIPMLKKLINQW